MTRSEIDWTFANQYRPKLCGDCKYFVADKRDEKGRLVGECRKLGIPTARTEWCQKPTEQREHQRAMLMYRGQNERDD